MKRVLSLLCLALFGLALVGTSPHSIVEANPLEPQNTPLILLTPENTTRPTEPKIIQLTLQNIENASRGYPPTCSLILREANLDSFRFTLRVVTTALFWQSENVETWVTFDEQAPIKLNRRSLDVQTAALVGAIMASEFDLNLSGIGEGSHNVKIRILSLPDTWEGNVTDYESKELDRFYFEGSVLYKIDTIDPAIDNISIANAIFFENEIELNCTVNEPFSWVAYSLDNQANVTIAYPEHDDPNNSKTVQVTSNLTNLTKGSHTLTIYAKDTAGNTGVSQTITFTVVNLEPFILLAVVLIVAAVAALLVLRRHRK